jgi:ribosomal protein L14E/L6E/L27E
VPKPWADRIQQVKERLNGKQMSVLPNKQPLVEESPRRRANGTTSNFTNEIVDAQNASRIEKDGKLTASTRQEAAMEGKVANQKADEMTMAQKEKAKHSADEEAYKSAKTWGGPDSTSERTIGTRNERIAQQNSLFRRKGQRRRANEQQANLNDNGRNKCARLKRTGRHGSTEKWFIPEKVDDREGNREKSQRVGPIQQVKERLQREEEAAKEGSSQAQQKGIQTQEIRQGRQKTVKKRSRAQLYYIPCYSALART